ncbi:MAG: hypothetical protein Q9163_001917 [Psora crenata]
MDRQSERHHHNPPVFENSWQKFQYYFGKGPEGVPFSREDFERKYRSGQSGQNGLNCPGGVPSFVYSGGRPSHEERFARYTHDSGQQNKDHFNDQHHRSRHIWDEARRDGDRQYNYMRGSRFDGFFDAEYCHLNDLFENLPHPYPSNNSSLANQQSRKMSLAHHPDRNRGDPTATARFQEIGAAYDTLKDPQKRAEYDEDRLAGNVSRSQYGYETFSGSRFSGGASSFGYGGHDERRNPFGSSRQSSKHFDSEDGESHYPRRTDGHGRKTKGKGRHHKSW